LNAALSSADGQDMYLMAGLATATEQAGVLPGPDQVYDFTIPAVVGGPAEVGNIGVVDFRDGCEHRWSAP
jgi:hypothetical protein